MSELLKKYSLLSLQSDKLNRAVYDNISILIKKYKITGKQVIKFIEDNNFINGILEKNKSDYQNAISVAKNRLKQLQE